MINIGEVNTLEINRLTDFGYFLKDEENNEVLIPNAYTEENWKIGDKIDVFIYKDSEDRIVATTLRPKIELYGFESLEVVDVNKVGAFLDWGLPKDLFVPYREQHEKMQVGESYPVTLYLDYESERLIASNKIDRFLELEDIELEEEQEVDLFFYKKTELGYNVVINNLYKGLVYHNQIFQFVELGTRAKGFINTIRNDKKIDVRLNRRGQERKDKDQEKIVNLLKKNNGYSGLHDKSSPDEIYARLKISKKAFKRAIGGLYKDKIIKIEDKGIRLN